MATPTSGGAAQMFSPPTISQSGDFGDREGRQSDGTERTGEAGGCLARGEGGASGPFNPSPIG
eukprot:5314038-Pleurochrysis_carterae.AAC.1